MRSVPRGPVCHECGAALPDDGHCGSRVHELLAIEAGLLASVEPEIGRRTHFFAVATYQLQHPSRSTVEALDWLRGAVARMVHDRVSTDVLLLDNRRALQGAAISPSGAPGDRRHVDPRWPQEWSVTAVEVIAGGEETYVEGVARWAGATVQELEQAVGSPQG